MLKIQKIPFAVPALGLFFSTSCLPVAEAAQSPRAEKPRGNALARPLAWALQDAAQNAGARVSLNAGARVSRVPIDTTKTVRDTLAIEEVEINAGYYTVKDRERTGSIGRVDAKTIGRQPVSNPLATLHGQIPGVEVTQLSGVPGGNIILRIRGQNSLLNGSDPLYIIDGVPFMAGQQPINVLNSAAGEGIQSTASAGISPLSMINPADIASIEILKDADATAIYGSRGANGVVLITTKKGTKMPLSVNAGYVTGISRPGRSMGMLTGPQYLAMRREAFANDGITPDATNAPDLLAWDTTQYTDFKNLLLGNSARYSDANISLTGGSDRSSYHISGSYHRETTVFSNEQANERFGFQANTAFSDRAERFRANMQVAFSSGTNRTPTRDLTRYLNASPYLKLHGDDGKLTWENLGMPYLYLGMLDANPLGFAGQHFDARLLNLNAQAQLSYAILPTLSLQTTFGMNLIRTDEESRFPSTTIDPYSYTLPSSNFGATKGFSWIVEPQLSYRSNPGSGRFEALIGASLQDQAVTVQTIYAGSYASDLLLGALAAAGQITGTNRSNTYRYQGVYARLNYNLAGRYILNLSGRRDGSSRFSPERRYANFAAVGAAWLFSEEPVFSGLTWLGVSKLRASYGITGNDQIGDYGYLDLWSPSYYTYGGQPTLDPVGLYNPAFAWERNRKLDLALESSLFNGRLNFSVNYFNNRSDNQLVQYTLPIQTGFQSVLANLSATIANSGLELALGYRIIGPGVFSWQTSFNATLPRNRLVAFPGIDQSSYRTRFVVGQPTTFSPRYAYLGVDPQSGIYAYTDVDGNGTISLTDAVFPTGVQLRAYGGWSNTFTYRSLEISFTLDYKRQDGYNYLNGMGGNVPGYLYANQPTQVLARWQQPGDIAPVQRFTSQYNEAYLRATYLNYSNGVIGDASFIRLRNVHLAYALPARFFQRIGFRECRLTLSGQNLLTITDYEGADPENQDLYVLPPLKTFVFGIQLTR